MSPGPTIATAPRYIYPNSNRPEQKQIQGLIPRKMQHSLELVNGKRHNWQQNSTKIRKNTACSNMNQPEGGAHRHMKTLTTNVYSDLEKSPWQHKSFIFTQVFITLCRLHRNFLTFREISPHTNHKLLHQCASTHLLRPRRKLLTLRFLSTAQTQNYRSNTSHQVPPK